jgi:hypothetical protein
MKPTRKFSPAFGILVLAALACNIGVNAPSSNDPRKAAATIVAMTLEAQGLPTSAGPTGTPGIPFASPVPATVTVTSTPAKAILTINGNSNCRSGPSLNFKVITAFTPGVSLDIVGRDMANNFWLVKIPNSEETCWVWGQYATPSGDYEAVAEVTPEASGQNQIPVQPGSISYEFVCFYDGSLQITTTLKWADRADNENGYRVYRSNSLIAELPANSTIHSDTTSTIPAETLSYSVTAFNNSGESAPSTRTFTNNCQ